MILNINEPITVVYKSVVQDNLVYCKHLPFNSYARCFPLTIREDTTWYYGTTGVDLSIHTPSFLLDVYQNILSGSALLLSEVDPETGIEWQPYKVAQKWLAIREGAQV